MDAKYQILIFDNININIQYTIFHNIYNIRDNVEKV